MGAFLQTVSDLLGHGQAPNEVPRRFSGVQFQKALDNLTIDPTCLRRRLALIPIDLAILTKYGYIH